MQFSSRVIVVAMTIVVLSGFVNLFAPDAGFYPATVIVDLCLGLCVCGSVGRAARLRGRLPIPSWMLAGAALAVVYGGLAIVSTEPLGAAVTSWRSRVLYGLFAVAIWILADSLDDVETLLRWAMRLGLVIAAVGICQYLFRDHLPPALLAPAGTEVFGYYGTDITRANGLVGNTIVYGTLLSLFYGLYVARWAVHPTWRTGIPVVITFVSIVLTFSRAAQASTVVTALVVLVVWWRRSRDTLLAVALVGAPLLAVLLWAAWPAVQHPVEQSFIVRGLWGAKNASVQGSDLGHAMDRKIALDAFHVNEFFGNGIATQAEGSRWATAHGNYSSDGALWAELAEGGLLLVACYVGLLLTVAWALIRRWRADPQDWVAVGLTGAIAYNAAVASWVNSAVFGKAPFVVFWILFGLCVTRSRLTTTGGPKSGDRVVDGHVAEAGALGVEHLNLADKRAESGRRCSPDGAA